MNKRFLSYLALFVLVAAVPLTVYLSRQQQDIRQRASESTRTNLFFTNGECSNAPLTNLTIVPNQPTSLTVCLDSKGPTLPIASYHLTVHLGAARFSSISFNQGSGAFQFNTDIIPPSSAVNFFNKTVDLAKLDIPPSSTEALPSGMLSLGTITLTPDSPLGTTGIIAFTRRRITSTAASEFLTTDNPIISYSVNNLPTPTLTPLPATPNPSGSVTTTPIVPSVTIPVTPPTTPPASTPPPVTPNPSGVSPSGSPTPSGTTPNPSGSVTTTPIVPSVTIPVTPPTTPPATVTPPATPPLNTITLVVDVLLQGIGDTGNRNPRHTERDVTVEIFNASGRKAAEKTGKIAYTQTGLFSGDINLGSLPAGQYLFKLKQRGFLVKLVPTIFSVTPSTTQFQVQNLTLITGDVNHDNIVDIADWNITGRNCFAGKAVTALCGGNGDDADVNDDAKVDGIDLQLIERNIGSRPGD